jgi:hypothetical protein
MPRRGNARQGPNLTGAAVCFASTSSRTFSTADGPTVGGVSPEAIRAALLRIGERILEVEGVLAEVRQLATTLEAEMCGLGEDVGRLNRATAPLRLGGSGA